MTKTRDRFYKFIVEVRSIVLTTRKGSKMYKPGECMKYMNVEMHPALIDAWYCADVSREVTSSGARVVPAPDMYDPALVLWSRTTQQEFVNKGGQAQLTPPKEHCDRALYILVAEEVATHVAAHTLANHVSQIKEMVGRTLTLVIFGVKDYFKSSRRKTMNSKNNLMTEIELEMAIADLLVSANCDAMVVNSPNKLALLIAQFTKAIAEAPYKQAKRACDEQAEFYMRGDNKNCVPIDKDGNGVERAWQQMLGVLPMSSLETSRALCAQYKNPRSLFEALESSNSVNVIADIGVSRAGVPGSKSRRIGPEFARKLHALFTAEDGDMLLD